MPSGISRKKFLQMLAVGVGQLVIPKAAMARANSRSVIIVGAGMAGLAANHVLRSAGARTLLLEARARTGGRIWTNPDKLDLGASWIQGRRSNPLLTMHGTHESGVVAANILLAVM